MLIFHLSYSSSQKFKYNPYFLMQESKQMNTD